jgi:transposase-like protein
LEQRDCRHDSAPPHSTQVPRSAFAGFRFPPDVIVLAVRWYLRFGQSYRDIEELLTERGVQVDHVTIHRWVQRFAPLLAEAARPCRHLIGDRWQVDETDVKVAGRWHYVYHAIDQAGQVTDVFVSHGAMRRLPADSLSGRLAPRCARRWRSSPTRQPPTRSCWGAAAGGVASHRSVCQQPG